MILSVSLLLGGIFAFVSAGENCDGYWEFGEYKEPYSCPQFFAGDDLDKIYCCKEGCCDGDTHHIPSINIRVTIGGVCALFIFIIVCVVICCCFCSCCCVNKRRRTRSSRVPRTRVAYSPANPTPTIINHTAPPQINNYHNHHVYPPAAGGQAPPSYGQQAQPMYPVLQTSNHQNASAPPPYPNQNYNPPVNPHYHL
ncbi:uncharacterized protein [Antedon mediterranea]|uniref:uncharacterized protein n=1 Tax=Antedon mediterranea TaxID=105859 RepID=UPI003AF73690